MIVVLIVYQYRAKRPLLTIRTMLTSTMPVAGIAVALFAAAASVSATALTAGALPAATPAPRRPALSARGRRRGDHRGRCSASSSGRRAIHYLPLAGMIFLAAGIAVFRIDVPSSQARH